MVEVAWTLCCAVLQCSDRQWHRLPAESASRAQTKVGKGRVAAVQSNRDACYTDPHLYARECSCCYAVCNDSDGVHCDSVHQADCSCLLACFGQPLPYQQ